MNRFTVAELKQTIAKCLGTESVSELDSDSIDTNFADLGYDSLAVYEVMTRLQDELGIPISDEEIDSITTPRLVIDFVNSRQVEVAG